MEFRFTICATQAQLQAIQNNTVPDGKIGAQSCQHFTGKGYSAAFVANMTHVIAVLRAMPETQIELTAGVDVLCACCPHNQEGACESSPKPSLYDQAVLQCCGLQMGQRLSWKEFQKHVSQRILERDLLEQVCRGCQWLSLCQETTKRIYSQ